MALVTWGVSVLSGLGALPRCMSDFTSWYATLGLWPNRSLNKTTHGDGMSASRLPRPIWLHTELQAPCKRHGMGDIHFTDEESNTQKG